MLLLQQNCYCSIYIDDGKTPTVRVVAEYDPPSSFTGEPPSYRAASALSLSCEVEGVDNILGLIYEWSSTCSGNCFTNGEDTATVSTPYLHSYDTGVHTCTVYDALGCAGNGSITVNVVGKALEWLLLANISSLVVCAGTGVVVQPGDKVLAKNSLIRTLFNNRIPHFHCLSGSSQSNIGKLIGPLGTDITLMSSDPFNVRRGRGTDPGTLRVIGAMTLDSTDVGIYTYRTPNENASTAVEDFHFGIYTLQYAGIMGSFGGGGGGGWDLALSLLLGYVSYSYECDHIIITIRTSPLQKSWIHLCMGIYFIEQQVH